MTEDWKKRAEVKRDAILAAIPKEWRIENPPNEKQVDVTGKFVQQFLSEREVEITETTADDIAKHTVSGTWKAEEVTRAFCHRAALAHQLTNCLHEIFFDAAIADAKALDEYYAKNKKPMGPLHGLPVSLKDQFHVKGVETTMGYVGWIGTFEGKTGTGKEKKFESEMVKELRNSGAVLYCKTSVPHSLMTGETVNNIIGYTWNPKNRNLASGGSSGGEGALIGLRGAPVGFGTDIGGSIRIPAAFNGLYGIRPSTGRMPYEGMANSMDGQNTILSVVGPLATSVPSLRLVMKALLAQKPWLHDPLVHEIPWRHEEERQILEHTGAIGDASKIGKLSFGVLRSDGIVNPLPPVCRAVDTVVKALEALGHEAIPWEPPSHKTLLDEGIKTWFFDGGTDLKSAFALSGEPMAEQISFYSSPSLKEFTASQIAATNVRLREIKKEYMEYWNSTAEKTSTGRPVDALIAPLAPFPAARPKMYSYYGYSTFVNVLDYTSVVVPVTMVDKWVDRRDEGYRPIDDTDKKVYESYDPEIYDGAHVSVQLVGRRLQEEKMLAIAEYVGKALGM
ncbi:amidase signature domain-containing protein [Clohesyomyces aquaticus]|uniref:amidase n=1 Tax=Clohesyomyces aquaticus TaxID=1231657 RepID=A0A1Y1ZLN2_9PLEO|nr:amidase signature domain-containing protein [Clohesyomyces aquaticus]